MKKKPRRRPRSRMSLQQQRQQKLFMAVGFYVVLTIVAIMGKLNWIVVGWYLFIGVVTYGVYAKDKRAAEQSKWRTSEATLHLLSVLGGWVGAMLAQSYLRHKTKKSEFRLAYYLTVLINLAGLLYFISGGDLSQF